MFSKKEKKKKKKKKHWSQKSVLWNKNEEQFSNVFKSKYNRKTVFRGPKTKNMFGIIVIIVFNSPNGGLQNNWFNWKGELWNLT